MCLNTSLVLMSLLSFNFHTDGSNCSTFGTCFVGISPQCFLYVSVVFLDDIIMKICSARCLHGLMLVEVVHVVACGKPYGIQRVFLHPQLVFVHDVIVVVALFV